MTVFTDTSALFSFLDRRDRDHEAARRTFEALLREEDVVTHNYVAVELVTLAHARLGASAARRMIVDLLPLIEMRWIDPPLHDAAASAFVASPSARISFVDRVSFEMMRSDGIERAFTFDRDFRAQGFETVP